MNAGTGTRPQHGRRAPSRFAAGLLAVVFALLLGAPLRADDADIAVTVNGTPITDAMVREVVKSLIVQRGPAPSSDEIAQLTDAALDSLIDLELLYQAAQQNGIRVSDQEVQAEIGRTKARVGGDAAFAAALKRSGLSEAQLVAETRKTMMVDRLVEQRLTNDVRITPDAARRFYDEHQQEFQRPEQAHVRELIVTVPADASPADHGKARQLADELHGQVRGAADFARFAKTYAADAASAAHGGDRGFVDRGTLPPPVDAVAFSLAIGKVSDVIESPLGYHVIEVSERRPASVVSFDEARPTVEQVMRESERRQRQQAYLAELRKSAKIERATPAPVDAAE